MARQSGHIRFTGTVGDLTLYKWEGQHFARMKSSLTGEQVRTQPRFKRTMELSAVIGLASRVASEACRFLEMEASLVLDPDFTWKDLRYALQRSATQMLRDGLCADAVLHTLKQPPNEAWLDKARARKILKKQKPRKRKTVEFFEDAMGDDSLKDLSHSVRRKLSFRKLVNVDCSLEDFLQKQATAAKQKSTGEPKQKDIFRTACRIGNAVYKQLPGRPKNNPLRR
ncbi:MAG TPA: hypothetical protein VF145_10530, partial [Chitinophagaceae bacterium]